MYSIRPITLMSWKKTNLQTVGCPSHPTKPGSLPEFWRDSPRTKDSTRLGPLAIQCVGVYWGVSKLQNHPLSCLRCLFKRIFKKNKHCFSRVFSWYLKCDLCYTMLKPRTVRWVLLFQGQWHWTGWCQQAPNSWNKGIQGRNPISNTVGVIIYYKGCCQK